MGTRGVILCAAVALSACGGASAATSSTGRPRARAATGPCGPAGATTLAASMVARVYASGGHVFGCSKHAAGVIELGRTQTCIGRPQIRPVTVKGELAAYGLRQCGVDTGQGSVAVRRLDTRRVLLTSVAIIGALRPESYSQVASLVLNPDGSVAWIGTAASVVSRSAETIEVHAVGRAGRRLLDSGAGIEPRSLRLRGSLLSWRHGAHTRTATLR